MAIWTGSPTDSFGSQRFSSSGEAYTKRPLRVVVVDLHRQLVLAQKAHAGPTNDGAVSSIGLVLADAEFDSN